jgi:hypothetical protein
MYYNQIWVHVKMIFVTYRNMMLYFFYENTPPKRLIGASNRIVPKIKIFTRNLFTHYVYAEKARIRLRSQRRCDHTCGGDEARTFGSRANRGLVAKPS